MMLSNAATDYARGLCVRAHMLTPHLWKERPCSYAPPLVGSGLHSNGNPWNPQLVPRGAGAHV